MNGEGDKPSTPGDVEGETPGEGDYLGRGTLFDGKAEEAKDKEREKSGRPSLSWPRVMSSKKGKKKGEDKERESMELEGREEEHE